jgi:predicted cupin superfamily sugar epimerase
VHAETSREELERLTAARVAATLGLSPHREGGYYRETYRSPIVIPTPAGTRSLATAILYLITGDDPSRFHRLRSDEVWFFHAGRPVEMVFLGPLETVMVGPQTPQTLAPGGRWMAARIAALGGRGPTGRKETEKVGARNAVLVAGGGPEAAPLPSPWALVSCVVTPGFEYDDFEVARKEELAQAFPEAADYVRELA